MEMQTVEAVKGRLTPGEFEEVEQHQNHIDELEQGLDLIQSKYCDIPLPNAAKNLMDFYEHMISYRKEGIELVYKKASIRSVVE